MKQTLGQTAQEKQKSSAGLITSVILAVLAAVAGAEVLLVLHLEKKNKVPAEFRAFQNTISCGICIHRLPDHSFYIFLAQMDALKVDGPNGSGKGASV